MALIEILGFTVPLEWFIGFVLLVVLFPVIVVLLFLKTRRKDVSPFMEDMAIIQPVDEHDNLQPGQLVGGLTRTETDLIVTHPEWKDEDGNEYSAPVPIERIVPFTFFDMSKDLKRLWVIKDKGHLEAASASVIISGVAKRYDPPMADRRKSMRFLVNPPGKGGSEFIKSKIGIALVVGLILGGLMTGIAIGAIAWK